MAAMPQQPLDCNDVVTIIPPLRFHFARPLLDPSRRGFMNHLELVVSHFQTLDIISPLMHSDQFIRMSCLWSEGQCCHSRTECVSVYWRGGGGGMQLGCIQFQTGRQMALEIKDNTADF